MSVAAPQQADVVIVGAGAGGSACAWRLAARGIDVVVLESGPWYRADADYRLHRDDWELSAFPAKAPPWPYTFGEMPELDPGDQDLRSRGAEGRLLVPGNRRRAWKYHHVRGVGGSTLHFTGEAQRLNPRSLRLASEFGVGADWPLDYPELAAYYAIAERQIGVAGPARDPRTPDAGPAPLPPHDPGYASRHLMRTTRALGLNWTPNALAVLSRPQDGRPSCNYCANCNRGCPREDKGSADVVFARPAVASGRCQIVPEATVLEVESGPNDRVRGVVYADAGGKRRRVAARVVVIACGAVLGPRLLLNSASRHAPEGLANESGLVGRNLLETQFWIVSGLVDVPLGSYRGLPRDIVCWDHNAPDAIPGTVGGCVLGPSTTEIGLGGPVAYAERAVPGWGLAHKRAMRAAFGRALSIGAVGESLPSPGSYVDLDPDERDAHGLALARIHSRPGELDTIRLRFMAGRVREVLAAAGAPEPFEEYGSHDTFSSSHVFGTCRMGTDPRASVSDPFGASHRWRNLFVTDASLFPSSGGGEAPSLTIAALALRAADRIAAGLAARSL